MINKEFISWVFLEHHMLKYKYLPPPSGSKISMNEEVWKYSCGTQFQLQHSSKAHLGSEVRQYCWRGQNGRISLHSFFSGKAFTLYFSLTSHFLPLSSSGYHSFFQQLSRMLFIAVQDACRSCCVETEGEALITCYHKLSLLRKYSIIYEIELGEVMNKW